MTRHLLNPLRRPATPRPTATRLDLVRLDDRLTPSASVGATGGVLFITGDAGDNDISFERTMTKGTKAEGVRVLDSGRTVGVFPLAGLAGFRFDGGGGDDTVAATPWMPGITDTTAAVEGTTLFVRGDKGANHVTLQFSGVVTKGSRDRDIDVYDGDYRVASFPAAALKGVTGVRFDGGPGVDTLTNGTRLTRLTGTTAGVSGGVLFIAGDADNNEVTFQRTLSKGSKAEAVRVLDFGRVVGEFPLAGLSGFRFDGGGEKDAIASRPWMPRVTDTTAAVEGGALVVRGDAGDNQVRLVRSGFVTKGSKERDIDVYDGDSKVATFTPAALKGVTGVRFDGGPGVDTLALGGTGLTRLTDTTAEVTGGVLFITGDAGDNDIIFTRLMTKGSKFEDVGVFDHGRPVGRFSLAGLTGFRFDGGGGEDTVGAAGPRLPRLTDTTAAVEGTTLFVRGDAGDNAVRLEQGSLTKGSKERGIDVYDGDSKVATFTPAALKGVTGVRFDGGPGVDTLALGGTGLTRLTDTTAEVRWPQSAPPSSDPPPISSLMPSGGAVPVGVGTEGPALGLAVPEATAGVAFDFHGARLADALPQRRASWRSPGLAELEVDHRDGQQHQ